MFFVQTNESSVPSVVLYRLWSNTYRRPVYSIPFFLFRYYSDTSGPFFCNSNESISHSSKGSALKPRPEHLPLKI